ncbi:MAG TPA: RNA polymerase sigma factor [Polyangiaceae bacterium]
MVGMDRELLLGFRAGRREALERVYWENVDAIETLVQAGLRRSQQFSPANVADLVQEIFAKAFSRKARDAYDGEREYGPFLRQLGRNALVDWLRSRGRELAGDFDLEALAEARHLTSEADNAPFPPDLVAITRRFVGRLGPELRGVHERRFLAAESQEQAAETLGISRQTLRTLERRLLDGLRREIRETELAERTRHFSQPSARPKPY